MAKLAGKTEWVDVGDGIQRLVVEGAPIPPGLGLEEHATGDEVDARSLSRPIVDEEASKPFAERVGVEPPSAGISTENVEKAAKSARRSAKQPAQEG